MKSSYGISLIIFLAIGPLTAGTLTERAVYRGLYNERYDASVTPEKIAAAGYNTVFLHDSRLIYVRSRGAAFRKELEEFAHKCREQKLRIVVGVAPICDMNAYLAKYPNEAEAMPVREAPYRVENGKLVPDENLIRNGSFRDSFASWDRDATVCLDSETGSGDHNSACLIGGEKRQYRIWQNIRVRPFQQYLLSAEIKTENLKASRYRNSCINMCVLAKTSEGKWRDLSFRHVYSRDAMQRTQNWKRYQIMFNTMEYTDIIVYLGAWDLTGGKVWFDNIQLKPAGFQNIVRRPSTPVQMTSVDGGKCYTEKKDFTMIIDPKLGNSGRPGIYNDRHHGPNVMIPAGSALKEGDRVKVSYYHAVLSQKMAAFCIHNPLLYQLIEDDVRAIEEAIQPDGYMLNIDEVRQYGYDPECEKSGMNAGQALGMAAVRCYETIRNVAPGRSVYLWNDMFDPFHNAKGDNYYYFVRGKDSLYGSWEKLPRDIIIVDWLSNSVERMKNSIEFFDKLGFKVITCPTYFDQLRCPLAFDLLKLSIRQPNVIGFAYVVWGRRYQHLDKVMALARLAEKETK